MVVGDSAVRIVNRMWVRKGERDVVSPIDVKTHIAWVSSLKVAEVKTVAIIRYIWITFRYFVNDFGLRKGL